MIAANFWLMVLAFVLGLVLTFASTIRRVRRDVPDGTPGADQPPGTDQP